MSTGPAQATERKGLWKQTISKQIVFKMFFPEQKTRKESNEEKQKLWLIRSKDRVHRGYPTRMPLVWHQLPSQGKLTLAQEISVSRSPITPSDVDFCTSSASVAESHSERVSASFLIFRDSWEALSRSCFPSVTWTREVGRTWWLSQGWTRGSRMNKGPRTL